MSLLRRIRTIFEDAGYELRARTAHIPLRVVNDVPYVCQFSVPEHAELTLRKNLSPQDDPYWQETGASSPERYAEWAFTMCGMASTAMALEHFAGKMLKPATLAEDALAHGVYLEAADGISSMRYREFTHWVRTHGLVARMHARLSVAGIRYALSAGCLVIVSVSPNIRGYATAPEHQKGGHLVLVTGYDIGKDALTLNNPSGFASTNTQHGHVIAIPEFARYFAGRGIVISSAVH